jgi:hypothetical protein
MRVELDSLNLAAAEGVLVAAALQYAESLCDLARRLGVSPAKAQRLLRAHRLVMPPGWNTRRRRARSRR